MYNGSIRELFKVLDQVANYQYSLVKVVGKACNMMGKGKEGRQWKTVSYPHISLISIT